MILIRPATFTLCLSLIMHAAISQQRSKRTDVDPASTQQPSITVGVDYTSLVTFWGRDFGEKQFGVAPYFLAETGIGLYGYAIADYWSKTPYKPATITLGLGYETELSEKFAIFASYERWINRGAFGYFNQAFQNQFGTGFRYASGKFSIEPSFSYLKGLEKIYQLDISLEREHTVLNLENGSISITPGFLATFATPVFSYIYYEFPDENFNYEKFRFVDAEANVSIILEIGSIELSGAMYYNVPVNVGNENLSPFLYYSAGMSYCFCRRTED